MKRTAWLLVPLLALLFLSAARGQGSVTSVEKLAVAIWPDYDRPSVLVLVTGTLGGAEPLPAVVTVPLPVDAQLNAVARIDDQGRMIDDIAYSAEAGKLTLTTPVPRFHVEYYLPYRIQNGERIFDFSWRSDLSLGQLEATVQRPAFAASLFTEPRAAEVLEGRDGLTYHRLPPRAVPGGQRFSLQIRYPMSTTRLSVERQGGTRGAPPPASPATPTPPPAAGFGWLAILAFIGMGLVAALVAWQLARSRSESAARNAAGSEAPAAHRFCHACGRALAEGDRFCRDCGADLQGR